jgi:hypothetical protein
LPAVSLSNRGLRQEEAAAAAGRMMADEERTAEPLLLPWMRWVLRVASGYNIAIGITMLCFYHEASKIIGMTRPEPIIFFQLAGLLIGLFGVGYWLVLCRPVQNRDLLWLGFWSKLLGPLLSVYHVVRGDLPWVFLPLVVFSDLVYLPLFYVIGKRLNRLAAR